MARTASITTDWIERAAVGASLACMVHCLALPLLIAALPALSSVLSIPESFHRWVLGIAVPMATLALLQGRSCHGHTWQLLAGMLGIALLGAGALLLEETPFETGVTVAGSLILAGAHVANWRLRHACC